MTLPVQYAAVVQQLERKNSELAALLREAQSLETAASDARSALDDREAELATLRHERTAWGEERAGLLSQLRDHQRQVQRYLDRDAVDTGDGAAELADLRRELEATSRRANAQDAALGEATGELDVLRARCSVLEQAREAALGAAAKYEESVGVLQRAATASEETIAALQTEVAEARAASVLLQEQHVQETRSLRDTVAAVTQHQQQAVQELQGIDAVEAQAKKGLAAEWMALAATQEEQRLSAAAASTERDSVLSVLARTRVHLEDVRQHAERKAALFAAEIDALHRENAGALHDVGAIARERDALRQQCQALEQQLRRRGDIEATVRAAHEAQAAIGPVRYDHSVQCGPPFLAVSVGTNTAPTAVPPVDLAQLASDTEADRFIDDLVRDIEQLLVVATQTLHLAAPDAATAVPVPRCQRFEDPRLNDVVRCTGGVDLILRELRQQLYRPAQRAPLMRTQDALRATLVGNQQLLRSVR